MIVFYIHLFLALILFFIINIIGKESSYNGYEEISVFNKVDDAPLFNLLYRAFSPVVFIVVLSIVFYELKLDYLVINIYLIVIYHFIIRFLFNLLMGRRKLINWKIQFMLVLISSLMAYFVYSKFILNKEFLFPSNEDIGQVIWLGILAYLYKTFNNMKVSSVNSDRRQNDYVKEKYNFFRKTYEVIINDISENEKQKALIYSVLILESFNRPFIYRITENLLFKIGKAKTLGVMQVTTNKMIDDFESVKLGSDKIVSDWNRIKDEFDAEYANKKYAYHDGQLIRKVLQEYNPSVKYINEVSELYYNLIDKIK